MTISGGYFLTRAVERPSYCCADLLPNRILSLSACICDFAPDLSESDWARKWAISPVAVPEFRWWSTAQFDAETLGWPRVFFSLRDARAFVSRFLSSAPDVKVLGIGLHPEAVESFPAKSGPQEGIPGIDKAVRRGAPLDKGGVALGWEVLCYDSGDFHSWLCNGLETHIARIFGIRPTSTGFIGSMAQALTAAEYCGREDAPAEPGFWAPWLVVEYALVENARL